MLFTLFHIYGDDTAKSQSLQHLYLAHGTLKSNWVSEFLAFAQDQLAQVRQYPYFQSLKNKNNQEVTVK